MEDLLRTTQHEKRIALFPENQHHQLQTTHSASASDRNWSPYSMDRCCRFDYNGDGNCHIHPFRWSGK